jgi:hypothetical protein
MPPRSLTRARYHYGYVDTLEKDLPLVVQLGGVRRYPNQFAAMPSVHICWATWCALHWSAPQSSIGKVLAFCYPIVTLIVIVMRRHYFLDAVGGLVILGLGWIIAARITLVAVRLRLRRSSARGCCTVRTWIGTLTDHGVFTQTIVPLRPP